MEQQDPAPLPPGRGTALLGFGILVGFELLGLGAERLGVPLPGSVLGLLLFTLALYTHTVKLEWVEQTAVFLVRHMTLLFIPITVALPGMSAELRRDAVALIASTVVSLVAVLVTTGGLAHVFLRDAPVAVEAEDEVRQ